MWKLLLLVLLVPQSLFGNDLELEISLSKKEIVQFEPAVLTVSLRNVSEKPQRIYWAFDPACQFLKIYVSDSAGKTRYLGTTIIANAVVEPRPLAPKQSVHHRVLLSPTPEKWMDKPGKYQLHATYQFSEAGRLDSMPVSIVVKPAEGIDKKALERFRGYPQAKFLARSTTAPAIADEFEAVIRQYPNCVYVPWCYYALGRAFQYRTENEKSQALNAKLEYGLLLEKYPNFPLKLEIEYEMARELFRLGKPNLAVRKIEKLIKVDRKVDNSDAELFLFYEARRILEAFGDGNKKKITFNELPSH